MKVCKADEAKGNRGSAWRKWYYIIEKAKIFKGYKVCRLGYIRYEPHRLDCTSLHLAHAAVAKWEK